MEQIQTTRNELKSPVNTPLVHCSDAKVVNAMSLQTNSNPVENSKLISHWGSGYNSEKSDASMSGRSGDFSPLQTTILKQRRRLSSPMQDNGVSEPN